jgi:CPA1 family monovalent cation:H+ antiporter
MIESQVAAFVVLLMVAVGATVVVRLIPIPYVVVLALVGALSGVFLHLPAVPLTRSLILFIVLPGLLFEAAFNLEWRRVLSDLPAIAVLATVGVLVTALVVAGLGRALLGLSFSLAFLLGTILAPTDPVAVVAVFRRLGVPKRLTTLVEAESLFNDGTGIVLFTIALQAVLAGQFHLESGILHFVELSVGGLAIGTLIGFLLSMLTTRIDDTQVAITYTAIGAYGTYLLAEAIHVSGILAVVAAALVLGNYGRRGMSEGTQQAVDSFWDYIAFLLNSLIFLLIGLDLPWTNAFRKLGSVAIALLILVVSRAVVVYGTFGALKAYGKPVPWSWQHLIVWSGIRGAVAVALALSLAEETGTQFADLLPIVYGVVLLSIIVQGVTVAPLAGRLTKPSEA